MAAEVAAIAEVVRIAEEAVAIAVVVAAALAAAVVAEAPAQAAAPCPTAANTNFPRHTKSPPETKQAGFLHFGEDNSANTKMFHCIALCTTRRRVWCFMREGIWVSCFDMGKGTIEMPGSNEVLVLS